MTIVQSVTTVGFPTVACICLALFIRKQWEEQKLTLNQITDTNKDLSSTNKMLVENFTKEMSAVKDEVADIGNKVDIINVKLDK